MPSMFKFFRTLLFQRVPLAENNVNGSLQGFFVCVFVFQFFAINQCPKNSNEMQKE